MYAIIDFKGQQHKVQKDDVLHVAYLEDKEIGSEIEIDSLLLLDDDKKMHIGKPSVKGAKVVAEVLGHGRGKKITVFKKKKRKSYSRKQGHRQNFTEIKIKDIIKN
ncbi:MAG: 50S ribosomal protein L21 [Candidatus Celaenobacter antarcticus]|nr:50S ribosomal protein L21 [Candidatus Celaenobacter antarcticus]